VFTLEPIGYVNSTVTSREHAPKQGNEGAPSAWLVFDPKFAEALADLQVGDECILLTWLDRADRATQQVHPRDDPTVPLRGVFSTRSQDRPNPIGIHRVKVLEIEDRLRVQVSDLEAFDRTPIIDLKPVLDRALER